MRKNKFLLLPIIFALAACGKGSKNNTDSQTYKDPEVAKAVTIDSGKKNQILNDTHNVFARTWSSPEGPLDTVVSIDTTINMQNTKHYSTECLFSFDNEYLEERVVETINNQDYSLDFIVRKENGSYVFEGAYGVYLEQLMEQVNMGEYMQTLCEGMFNSYKKSYFLTDAVLDYMGNSLEASETVVGNNFVSRLKQEFMEKTICTANDSNGNCTLEISSPINYYSVNYSYSDMTTSATMNIESLKFVFKDYRLETSAFVLAIRSSQSSPDYNYSSLTCMPYLSLYSYNVDENNCFSDTIPLLSVDELNELLNS